MSESSNKGLQFRLRHVLSGMAILSIVFALLFAVPDRVVSAVVMIGSVLFAAIITSAIVYGRGGVRAFCIGAIFPIALILASTVSVFVVATFQPYGGNFFRFLEMSGNGMRFNLVVGCLLTPISGLMSVFIRRYVQNRE